MAWSTSKDPRTEFVTLRLTLSEAAELDALAARTGSSRSDTIRAALVRVVRAERRKTELKSDTPSKSDSAE